MSTIIRVISLCVSIAAFVIAIAAFWNIRKKK